MHAKFLLAVVCLCVVGGVQGASSHSAIRVGPADPVSISSTVGQNPAVESISFIITNSGRGIVRWSAGVDADWVELSPASGRLLPHRHVKLTARILDVSLFRSGIFTATVAVTNLSCEQPPEFQRIILKVGVDSGVRLPAPELVEPPFTRGTSNTLTWARIPGANEYQVQAAVSPDFSDAITSGWMPGTNHTFVNLLDGLTYYYRVQCRSNSSMWSQTLAGQFATNDNRSVSIRTQPGDLVLEGNTNRIWFEDFESSGESWTNTLFSDLGVPFGNIISGEPRARWEKGPLGTEAGAPDTEPPLPINQRGDHEGRLSDAIAYHRCAYMTNVPDNVLSGVTVDAFLGLRDSSQSYIVTAGVAIRVKAGIRTNFLNGDGYLAFVQADGSKERMLNIYQMQEGILYGLVPLPDNRFPVEDPDENYHLRFAAYGPYLSLTLWRIRAMDGIIKETPVQLGNGTNVQRVFNGAYPRGIAGLTGMAWGGSSSAFFDDVTIMADHGPPHYAWSGSSTAVVTPPAWFERWGRLAFTASCPNSNTAFTVDILNAKGLVLASNVPSGTDLNTIPAVARSASVQIRANFSTTDPAHTPALSDWTVAYHLPEKNASQSDWSPVVVSAQDNLSPVLSIVNPAVSPMTVSNATFGLQGTAFDSGSGVARVRLLAFSGFNVRSFDAETTNGFADWSVQLNLLPGENILRVTATDNTVPPISSIAGQTVIYRPPILAANESMGEGVLPEVVLPALHLQIAEGTAMFWWFPSMAEGGIQTATTLSPADWTNLVEATRPPVTVPVTQQNRFFRLRLK